eukprot:TRINITY_DN23473_c0_g1_i1.p1 TRINITY_DN23473_c0_g1~~TRINITY_DN23473_c0_g1_i1.p1  ORF type:complete len:1574 (-),score=275.63 TRINITY_DN23473_c0_g1_i1:32-4753(-)
MAKATGDQKKTKGGGKQLTDLNWESLNRDEIYRQRVLGTDSGMSSFIRVDDKKKLTLLQTIVYAIFLFAGLYFDSSSEKIVRRFGANSAIQTWLTSRSYRLRPTPAYFHDIRSLDDVREYLRFAFPMAVIPTVQQTNFPVFELRFTMRRMIEVDSADERFKNLAPRAWKDKAGITSYDRAGWYDDQNSFGAYRAWRANRNTTTFDYCRYANYDCKGAGGHLVGARNFSRNLNRDEVTDRCQAILESGEVGRSNCLTVYSQDEGTLFPKVCEFYWLPPSSFADSAKGGMVENIECTNQSYRALDDQADVVFPQLVLKQDGSSNIGQFASGGGAAPPGGVASPGGGPGLVRPVEARSVVPIVKQFTYSQGAGWSKTPGFVIKLLDWQDRNATDISKSILYKQLDDWIAGGFLATNAAALMVDFVSWNPYLEVFTWVQINFLVESSGEVRPSLRTLSLTAEEGSLKGRKKDSMLWQGFGLWDGIYVVLVFYYLFCEIYELMTAGTKYFTSGWQLLSATGVLCHITLLGLKYQHHIKSEFTNSLVSAIHGESTSLGEEAFVNFETEALAFNSYQTVTSLMYMFLWFNLVHYLSDSFPRIEVLVDTVSGAITPVFFLVLVLVVVLIGFVLMCNLMFGWAIVHMSDFVRSGSSLIEMLFGRMDVVRQLQDRFPLSGFFFYLAFMTFFYFILQYLAKAIVVLAFEDASTRFEARKQELETRRAAGNTGNDQLTKAYKYILHKVREVTGLDDSDTSYQHLVQYPRYGLNRDSTSNKSGIVVFGILCICYVFLFSAILRVQVGHEVAESLTMAIKDSTYVRTNPLMKETESVSFDQIESWDDVQHWMDVALPKTLFNSSEGTYGAQEIELKEYSVAKQFEQLVINDWNVVVGQEPVRLSVKYNKIEPVSPDSATTRLDVPQFVRSQTEAVKSKDDIVNPSTRALLERYCNNATVAEAEKVYQASGKTETGFRCMLSVDAWRTQAALNAMREGGIVSNQTTELAIDFVVYNGNANMFAYTSVVFQFEHSGVVSSSITCRPFQLPRTDTSDGAVRILLEMAVLVLTLFYLALNIRGVLKSVNNMFSKGRPEKIRFLQRSLISFKVVSLHIFGNPFNLLELVSSIMTLAIMLLWYRFCLSPVPQGFFFPETPEWTKTQCANMNICEDAQMIAEFSKASDEMALFARLNAVNTVVLFFRALKYLETFPHFQMLLNSFIRGAADIAWLFVVWFVIALGFVNMGITLYGPFMVDFKNQGSAIFTCFQMLLGTFREFVDMRQAASNSGPFLYYFYWGAYMIIFRYVLINMFFAILMRNFKEEDKDMEVRLKAKAAESSRDSSGKKFNPMASFRKFIGSFSKMSLRRSLDEVDPSEPSSQAATPSGSTNLVTVTVDDEVGGMDEARRQVSTASVIPSSAETPGAGLKTGPIFKDISQNTVEKADTWKYLPQPMKEWAVTKAQDLSDMIMRKSHERAELEVKKDQYLLDRFMQETDDDIFARRRATIEAAESTKRDLEEEELASLKEIHRDQESLAWYIMKREAELKKLEDEKQLKQERYDKMVKAAQSLISSEQGEDPASLGTLALPQSR